jgi:hypothetical protein
MEQRIRKAKRTWLGMRQRCYNPKATGYEHYGGRGIHVLYFDFQAFVADVGLPPSPGHSVDRVNPDGNYEPGNCRWATAKLQGRNRRGGRTIEWRGQRIALSEWAELNGVPYGFAFSNSCITSSAAELLRMRVLHLNKVIRRMRAERRVA